MKNFLIKSLLKSNLARLKAYRKDPWSKQEKLFDHLIKQGRKTAFGKDHEFEQIRNPEDFRQRVPLFTYEEFLPYIDRLMKDEQGIIWPDQIKWFAKSSGTTAAKSKFIPVSKENLKTSHLMGGRDIMTWYCHLHPNTKIFRGKTLIMGGSTEVNQHSNGSYYGDVSAVMLSNTPPIANILRAPSKAVALMANWDEKIDAMIKECLNARITSLAGVPTWTIVLIREMFERTGKNNLADIWPDLELYVHGGVSFTPYRNQFQQLIRSSKMNYLESYNASEGFFAFQDDPEDPGMLLMTDHGTYYEFIPLDELANDSPRSLNLTEVEIGKAYALAITTNAGLWRYLIGDTVEFTSTSPHRIKIVGRTKHYINAFGEELMVSNTDKAIDLSCKGTEVMVADYTAAPIFFEGEAKGGHEWIIAFEQAPEDLEAWVISLDKNLQQLNSDYEAKRFQSMALELPKVHAVDKDFFQDWLRANGKLGGQHKVPRLSNDRKRMEELLKFLKTYQ